MKIHFRDIGLFDGSKAFYWYRVREPSRFMRVILRVCGVQNRGILLEFVTNHVHLKNNVLVAYLVSVYFD